MAYVRAIAAMAGYSVQFRKEQYKVDGEFYQIRKIKGKYEECGHALQFELKSSFDFIDAGDKIKFDLDADNYNQLVRRSKEAYSTLQILILLCMPKDNKEWVNVTDEELVLRKCCFWHQFVKEPETNNKETRRIEIPTTQQFTLETLDQLFTKIGRGERVLC